MFTIVKNINNSIFIILKYKRQQILKYYDSRMSWDTKFIADTSIEHHINHLKSEWYYMFTIFEVGKNQYIKSGMLLIIA